MPIETVQVVRPIKILAFICGIISVFLLIISIASNAWVEARHFYQGLWKVCIYHEMDDLASCSGPDAESKGWILACGILCIVSLLIAVAVCILTGYGLWTRKYSLKFMLYRLATFLMFGAFVVLVISLIVFPIMFVGGLHKRSEQMRIHEWYFGWSYGLSWGTAIFQLGCAILLLIDKESEQIYYKERTTEYYHD